MKLSKIRRREALDGFICISPWLFGFIVLTLGPMLFSLYISFTEWDILTTPKFVGLANYKTIFFDDFRFAQAMKVTLIYALTSVPIGLVCSLALAVLLNQNVFGMRTFRSIFYIPAILPPVAMAMVWLAIFKPHGGILNAILGVFKIPEIGWLQDPAWALPSFILMSVWGVGGGMIIYLAGLQGVPTQLYEAAEIDGASPWQKFRNITLPMISSTIFFNLVMGIIGSFQVFTSSFVMTQGGPAYATLFYVLYLYQKAFMFLQMGYACALAWILFIVILIFTLIILKSSSAWVYYEAEVKK